MRMPLLLLLVALCAGTLVPLAHGQTAAAPNSERAAPSSAAAESLETVESGLAALEASDLDEAAKAKARDFYQQAKQELDQQATWNGQAAEFQTRATEAPQRLRETERLLETGTGLPPLQLPRNVTLAELEKMLGERRTELAAVDEVVRSLDAEPQRRASRKVEIPKEIAALREQVQEVTNQLNTPADPSEPALVSAARRVLLRSRLQNRTARIAALEAENAAYEAENSLLALDRTYQRSRQAHLAAEVKQLTDEVNRRRHDEAARRHERVRRQRDNAHPALRQMADSNFRRSEETLQLAHDVSDLVQRLAVLKQQQSRWADKIARMKRRVDRGATETTVHLLQHERVKLPHTIAQHRRALGDRQQRVRDAQSRMNDLQDESDMLADVDMQVENLRQKLNLEQSPDEELELTARIRELVVMQRELINDQLAKTSQHFDALVGLNETEELLVKELEDYADYISERIFWIPNAPPLSLHDFQEAWTLLVQLTDQQLWRSAGRQLAPMVLSEIKNSYLINGSFLILLLVLLSRQRALRRALGDEGLIASRGNCIAFAPTARALVITLLIALPWAMLLAYAGWRLNRWSWLPQNADVTLPRALAAGFQAAARLYFPLEFFRQVCRRRGLAESHFNWSERTLLPLRIHLRWSVTALLLLTFLVALLREFNASAEALGVARLLHIVRMLVIAVFMQIVFRPQRGALQDYLLFHPNSWTSRLWFVWYPALCLLPVALAVLAGLGYFYTSWQLAMRLHRTLMILTGLTIVGAVLLRWLLVSRRRLAIKQAEQRQQRFQEQVMTDRAGNPLPPFEEPGVDLAAINAQTRTLIRSVLVVTGFFVGWLIWVDVLPALAILRDVNLYPAEGLEPGTIVQVTLADLLRAVVVMVMAWIAARNLPGLTEILLLQHLPLDSSVRYAITTMARYVIAIVGIVVTCAILGVSWRRAQWLVAALGVGLGFGLQEIFANLVSGIILLFERPIRVGDVITLGDVTGQVTRIRIRATTLTDWDRKELIVPNKDLITGRLLNWTLSDSTNRVLVKVGVARSADVRRARELMLEIAHSHPNVLKDPAPSVTFEAFGPSTRDLVLRAYLPSLDLRLPTTNDLHMQINERFGEEGIEIAFPQLDLHVRSTTPLPIHRNGKKEGERMQSSGLRVQEGRG